MYVLSADLVLGYGYTEDVEAIIAALPVARQTYLMSATLGEDVQKLQTQVGRFRVFVCCLVRAVALTSR